MINSRYNFLTIVKQSEEDNSKYVCRCDCGKETIVSAYRLQNNTTKSCGCLQKKKASTLAGMCAKFHKEYQTWMRMKLRCSATADEITKEKYFNRGITVCDRWLSFENFLEDMGTKPDGQELDRINNDLGYCFENCRWTTEALNAFNRRQRNSKSGMTGIFKKPSGSYDVTIGKKHLGTFKNLRDAIQARAAGELSEYGSIKKETNALLISLSTGT